MTMPRWSEEDKKTADDMHEDENTYREIANQLGKTYSAVNSFLYHERECKEEYVIEARRQVREKVAEQKRLTIIRLDKEYEQKKCNRQIKEAHRDKRIREAKELKETLAEEREILENHRMECYVDGLCDNKSALVCGDTPSQYRGWRVNRGLEINYESEMREMPSVDEIHGFKPEYIKFYKHNDNKPTEYFYGEIKIIIPASVTPLLAPITSLADQDRVTARKIVRNIERKNYTYRNLENNLTYVNAHNIGNSRLLRSKIGKVI